MSRIPKKRRLAELQRTCREHGLSVTVQRHVVFEAIIDREDHPTADQIHNKIKIRIPSISRTTVYRILDTLVELELIKKICHPSSAARFDPHTHQHHHLICTKCDTIVDIEAQRLNKVIWPDVRDHGFEIQDYHIHFRGICANCRGKASAKSRALQKMGKRRTIRPACMKQKRTYSKRSV